MSEKIRYGMVGGGEGAFIGAVHRMAAALDGQYELVCGAFSSDPDKALRSGLALGIPAGRSYSDFQEMCRIEAGLPQDKRMQVVVVVTPNHLHYPVVEAALQHGFHVMSDKPATATLEEARRIASLIKEAGLLYGLTHTYVGYPLVREARERVASGQLGTVRKVIVEYIQGWLSEPIETGGNAQASWRTDPARAGGSCCMGDIGVHAFNLAEFVTGLEVSRLSAHLSTFVPGRRLDDDGTVLLEFDNGAQGVLLASQICIGEENGIRLRVFGDKASLDWHQLEPNSLYIRYPDRPTETIRAGTPYLGEWARTGTRTPAGHPEGYLEAFANLYADFALAISQSGHAASESPEPGIEAALRGMAFIEQTVTSYQNQGQWVPLKSG